MLLILIAVHLLSTNSSTSPHPLDARATTDSCDDINSCRTFFSIVWGCPATIFACTWVSVHPNVPPPGQSRLRAFWRRLKMMLVGIIVPEVMVGFAATQRFGAHLLAKEYKFSRTHGFFFCMGGFVSSAGYPIATRKQLEDRTLGREFQEAIRNVNEDDIMDKSKGDALSKGVALLQGLWFTVQCLARVHQRLAVTQLEVATLAFAVVNIFIWLLWWEKPLDVQRPIVVGPITLLHPRGITPLLRTPSSGLTNAILAFDNDQYDPLSSNSVPLFGSLSLNSMRRIYVVVCSITAVGTVFGAVHCAAWNTIFPTNIEMWLWRSCSSLIAALPGLGSLQLLLMLACTRIYEGEMILVITSLPAMLAGAPIYVTARVILIVLPFASLRSLPPSAFVDVNWSTYIPHI
ncbi:hypothetical protein MSAN_00634700 [Mycena sanguinolenta]|uniref:Uncharacterized protein n=1 Tax=Mycena sanguinolenta TaxID=230812 RepID=A0A8H7DEH2_9AGAR|nr:hypothetical protein MSAN_00634700 [Mycena sanguinolenta]